MDKVRKVYGRLFDSFGKQGWWPLTISGYESRHYVGRPKLDNHRFEIIIGAILTQNTNWKNVHKALYNLSKSNLIDLGKISKLNQKRLGDLIMPAGYYNQKAERLKIVAKYILDNYEGDMLSFFNYKLINDKIKKSVQELRDELLAIKGIGPETADSIILYSAEKPVFVIDAYTKRIFERLGYGARDYDGWQSLFMDNLEHDLDLFKEYHALLVELGKNHCKTRPVCVGCPVKDLCKNKLIENKQYLKNKR